MIAIACDHGAVELKKEIDVIAEEHYKKQKAAELESSM